MNIEKVIEVANWLGKDQDVYTLESLKRLEERGEHFVTFWGHYSAGKSRLINNIIGRDILPVQSREATAALTYIRYGNLERCIIHFINGTDQNIDISELKNINQNANEDIDLESIDHIEVFLTEEVLKSGIIIVDTPGINTIIQRHQELAVDAIEQSGMIVYVLGASPTKVDQDFITQIDRCGIDILFARTKCDRLNSDEEDEMEAIEKDKELLKSMISKEVKIIPVSNEKDSRWYSNISQIHNVLEDVSADIKDKIKAASKLRLEKYVEVYRSELEKQKKLMQEQLQGSSKQLEEEIRKCDTQLERLKVREEEGKERIRLEVEQSGKHAKRSVEDIADQKKDELREKLEELSWSSSIKAEADSIYRMQMNKGLEDVYFTLNESFNRVLEDENKNIEDEFPDLDIEMPEIEIGMVERDNERWRAISQEKIAKLQQELENILEEKVKLDHSMQDVASEEEIREAKLQLEEINKAMSEIPSEPAMIEVESRKMQPSEILKKVGQVADIATLVLPGEAFVQGAKALAGTAKVGNFLSKSSYVVNSGKKILDAANTVDKIRDTGYLFNIFKKIINPSKEDDIKKKAVEAFVLDKAGKAQKKFVELKESTRDTSIFDMFSIAYWTEKLGKNFDEPPHLEIDYDEEARRKQQRGELEAQKNAKIEAIIKRKKEMNIIQNEKEELEERERQLKDKQEWLKKEEMRISESNRREREVNEKRRIIERYTEHFQSNFEKISNTIANNRIKMATNSIEIYIDRKNIHIKDKIDEKKAQLENLKALKKNGEDELKQHIQQCEQYRLDLA